jgi:hypothetical protein
MEGWRGGEGWRTGLERKVGVEKLKSVCGPFDMSPFHLVRTVGGVVMNFKVVRGRVLKQKIFLLPLSGRNGETLKNEGKAL